MRDTCLVDVLVTLDPSSTRTGFAVFLDRKLCEAGYFRPAADDPSERRIDSMADDLRDLIDRVRPGLIVIEVPSGKPGTGLKRGAGAHLAVYGVAVGELRRVAKTWAQTDPNAGEYAVVSVTEREWTRGTPKRTRQRRIAMLHPGYAAELARDRGGDVADAIGLGEWWLSRKSRQPELERC